MSLKLNAKKYFIDKTNSISSQTCRLKFVIIYHAKEIDFIIEVHSTSVLLCHYFNADTFVL